MCELNMVLLDFPISFQNLRIVFEAENPDRGEQATKKVRRVCFYFWLDEPWVGREK